MLDRPVTNRGWVAAVLVALGVPQALTGRWALLALGYAVELGLLGSNPVDRIQWSRGER